jgi:hypothetical protein
LPFVAPARPEAQCHVQKLVASDAAANQHFGGPIDFDGQRAIVGSRSKAYIFERRNGLWVETQVLTLAAGAFFPRSAIDGDTALIVRSGHPLVDVFELRDGTWVQTDILPTERRPYAVALSGDTALVPVGVSFEVGEGIVFERQAGRWTEVTRLSVDLPAAKFLGMNCEIEGDRALISAQSDGDGFAEPGRVYLFERSGRRWAFRGRLKPDESERGDLLGVSMAIDGDRILIGGPADCEFTFSTLGAYVFELQGGLWQQSANLIQAAIAPIESFGGAVGFARDRVLVSDPRGGGIGPGLLYVFEPSASGWSLAGTFDPGSGPREYGFGSSIAARGDVAFVGHGSDDDLATDAGAVYVLTFACPPPARAR